MAGARVHTLPIQLACHLSIGSLIEQLVNRLDQLRFGLSELRCGERFGLGQSASSSAFKADMRVASAKVCDGMVGAAVEFIATQRDENIS